MEQSKIGTIKNWQAKNVSKECRAPICFLIRLTAEASGPTGRSHLPATTGKTTMHATRTRVSAPPWRRSLVAFPRSDAAYENAKAQLQPTRVGQPPPSISIPIPTWISIDPMRVTGGHEVQPRNGEPPSPMRMKGKMKKHFVPNHLLPHPRAMVDRLSLVEMARCFVDPRGRRRPRRLR